MGAYHVTAEDSINAIKNILEPLLDDAGATLAETARVVARCLKQEDDGRLSLDAVKVVWQARGLLIDRKEVKIDGALNDAVVAYLSSKEGK